MRRYFIFVLLYLSSISVLMAQQPINVPFLCSFEDDAEIQQMWTLNPNSANAGDQWVVGGVKIKLLKLFTKPLSRLRRQRLAAARSRHGSDSPPDCHSLPYRHFATLQQGEAWIISADFKFNHEIYVMFSLP